MLLAKAPVEEDPLQPEEEEMLKILRANFSPELQYQHELTLLRFIRGFCRDPAARTKIPEVFNNFLRWREDNKVEELNYVRLHKTDAFKRMWMCNIHGVSKTGHPVYVEKPCKVEFDKLFKEFTFDNIKAFHVQMMERLSRVKEELSRLTGKRIYKHVVILDLDGVGMKHLSSQNTEPLKKMVHIDQEFYPETLLVMIIVNAPFIFKAFWKVASLWLDPVTKSRIMFGREHIPKYIDEGNTPQYLGGKCKCTECLVGPFVPGGEESKSILSSVMADLEPEVAAARRAERLNKAQSTSTDASAPSAPTEAPAAPSEQPSTDAPSS